MEYHGTMQWMAKDPERRADPRKILPGCQSIICVGMNYWTDIQPEEGPGYGRIARYAWGKDYHHLLQKRLKNLEQSISEFAPESTTRSYVDTGPIMEKIWAQRAGLGWIGKHSNLVSPTLGSWLLLGEILTTLELEPDEPGSDLCGTCTLCIRACPTQAITEPYIVDATKCISYLTIEYRDDLNSIPQELRSQMGNRIFGCDDCQLVCPWNKFAQPTAEGDFAPRHGFDDESLVVLFRWSEAEWASATEGSALRRVGYQGWLRNLAVALGNAPTKAVVVDALRERLDDPSELVREHVQWALSRHEDC